MSPRNFAKHQYRDATFIYGSRHPRFLKDREPNKLITKIKNKVYTYKAYISSFTKKVFKSPAKVQFEHLPYQTSGTRGRDRPQSAPRTTAGSQTI